MIELMHVILGRAEREMDLLMPGYTHLQRGQVSKYFAPKIIAKAMKNTS